MIAIRPVPIVMMHDRQQHGGAAARAVGIGAEHERAERPHQIRHAERAEGQQQRGGRSAVGKNSLEMVTAK